MYLYRLIFLGILLFSGCAVKEKSISQYNSQPLIKPFEETKTPPPPPMVFESPYKKISPLENKTITISAKNAPLSYFLYSIAKTADLNLVIGKDVNINQKITLNLDNAPLDEALNVIMDITGYYYEIKGNILYIKQYMTKIFKIPYIHTNSSYSSELGGDVLGVNTANNNSNVKGDFSLKYKNPEEAIIFTHNWKKT